MMKDFLQKMNNYASKSIPFIFLIDFEMQKPLIYKIDEAKKQGLIFKIANKNNYKAPKCVAEISKIHTRLINPFQYIKMFDLVQKHLKNGDTYLLNLTVSTKILTTNSLEEIFYFSKAPYKLLLKNKFVLFSPETFVKTVGNSIYSFPMKGTINADIPNAENIILSDKKELFEHNTIVDLIRNDLSMIAKNVKINRYRYIDKIKSNNANLLQVSSEIEGELPENWQNKIGDLIVKLLPAGSISGAPKQKTIEIIKNVEKGKRGYYTGIFGIFDGQNIDTAVNIRFIEYKDKHKYYRSGGGITAMSDYLTEYNELKQKIYVPIN